MQANIAAANIRAVIHDLEDRYDQGKLPSEVVMPWGAKVRYDNLCDILEVFAQRIEANETRNKSTHD